MILCARSTSGLCESFFSIRKKKVSQRQILKVNVIVQFAASNLSMFEVKTQYDSIPLFDMNCIALFQVNCL